MKQSQRTQKQLPKKSHKNQVTILDEDDLLALCLFAMTVAAFSRSLEKLFSDKPYYLACYNEN